MASNKIKKVLRSAILDHTFRTRLQNSPSQVIDELGLTASDRSTLASVDWDAFFRICADLDGNIVKEINAFEDFPLLLT